MPYHILVVCTGNTCRSPMAEGLLRKLAQEHFPGKAQVSSAGTGGFEGLPASEFGREVIREDGIDLDDFRSSPLDAHRIQRADLILTMSPSHRDAVLRESPEAAERTFLLKEFGGTASGGDVSVPDPIGGSVDIYRDSYRQIKEAILAGLPRLRKLVE